MDPGEKKLMEFGYKQELKRDLSWFTNFAATFSVISLIAGAVTLYGIGFNYGGPVAIIWGWAIVSFFTLMVALSMAEITSAFPTSGGLYFWSSRLVPPEWAPLASWVTGWFNLLGQISMTAGVDLGLTLLISQVILLSTGNATGGGIILTNAEVVAIFGGLLLIHAILNSFAVKLLAFINTISVAWHMALTFLIIVLLPAIAPHRQSASYVFTTFNRSADAGLPQNNAYVFLLGLLMAQYTLNGFDTAAHLSEETRNPEISGPLGIITSIGVSAVLGWGLLLALTFSIQDPSYLLDPTNETAGSYPSAQIFYDAFNARYGSGTGGIVLLAMVCVAIFFCGVSSVTSNSRMLYAFSRDGAVPGSKFWHRVHPTFKSPIYAVWICSFISFLLGLPYLYNYTAFTAVTSIATIGLYISFVIPIFLRIAVARSSFQPGYFNLGIFSYVIGTVSVLWVGFITVLFCLPTLYPIERNNFNYASIAVGAVVLYVSVFWVLSARKWFSGPVSNLKAESIEPEPR